MKIIISILLFSLTLFANTKPCMLDVYYGNGVWNDRNNAIASKLELKIFMQQDIPDRFPGSDEGITYSFKYAYNPGHGYLDDLVETYWQLYDSAQISQGYFTAIATALNLPSAIAGNLAQKIQDIIDQYALDTDIMLNNYKKSSFDENNNVLLVAHSQGNLFGNKIHKLLSDDEKEMFRMVSVATPADNVNEDYSTTAPYTTLKYDILIAAIYGSLPSNEDGFGHTFVNAYLNASDKSVKNRIMADIIGAVDVLDQRLCERDVIFSIVGFMCRDNPESQTSLLVELYETSADLSDGNLAVTQLVMSEKKSDVKVFDPNTNSYTCPLEGWDFKAIWPSRYNKDGCDAYLMNSSRLPSDLASVTYENGINVCTEYKMSSIAYSTLEALR